MKRTTTIDGDTLIEELLERHPDLAGVFVRIGLPCFTCGEPAWGTVGELCARHGRDLGEVLSALRAAVSKPS
ncbi:DUF1858 domain-containing protein [candidate division WOR-3 bacterium]|nr:DUF1858 domain-containing protein [candidate division WOR-3 bacterium]